MFPFSTSPLDPINYVDYLITIIKKVIPQNKPKHDIGEDFSNNLEIF